MLRVYAARYHRLIAAFRELTGAPMVLNASFNENEPVVCEPKEALKCFLRTRMDVLVMGVLDSVGSICKQARRCQSDFFLDRTIIPLSRLLDKMLARFVGRSAIAVWQRSPCALDPRMKAPATAG